VLRWGKKDETVETAQLAASSAGNLYWYIELPDSDRNAVLAAAISGCVGGFTYCNARNTLRSLFWGLIRQRRSAEDSARLAALTSWNAFERAQSVQQEREPVEDIVQIVKNFVLVDSYGITFERIGLWDAGWLSTIAFTKTEETLMLSERSDPLNANSQKPNLMEFDKEAIDVSIRISEEIRAKMIAKNESSSFVDKVVSMARFVASAASQIERERGA